MYVLLSFKSMTCDITTLFTNFQSSGAAAGLTGTSVAIGMITKNPFPLAMGVISGGALILYFNSINLLIEKGKPATKEAGGGEDVSSTNRESNKEKAT